MYDPSGDPRYIPPDDLQERQETERDDEMAVLARELHLAQRVRDLFETDGWGVIAARIAQERESLQAAADKALDAADWKFLRGQIVAVDYFLSLPRRMDALHESLQQRARNLEPPSGGEEEQS